jgi:dihydrofolate synthase/folylpolyglutamate synthase
LCSRSGEYELHLLLPGQHQEQNLLTAVIAAETLAESGWHQIDEEAVEAGVARCTWPGRLERVEIPGAQLVVLDSAHNPNAAQALARFLDQHLQSYCLLFGVLEDKDAGEMLPPLLAGASSAVLTRPRSSRGRSARDLMRWVSDSTELTVVDDPDQALSVALAKAEPVVVCGCIYLVGEVRQSLRRRFGTPPPA